MPPGNLLPEVSHPLAPAAAATAAVSRNGAPLERGERRRRSIAVVASDVGGGGEEDKASGPADGRLRTEDETPILYIKGLKDGGGVGVWGNSGNGDGEGGGDDQAKVRGALRAAQVGQGDGAEGEEEQAMEGESAGIDWERVSVGELTNTGSWSKGVRVALGRVVCCMYAAAANNMQQASSSKSAPVFKVV